MNCQRFITSEDTSGVLPPTTPIYFLCFKTKKIQGFKEFWGVCFPAYSRNTTPPPMAGSNSIAYCRPSQ